MAGKIRKIHGTENFDWGMDRTFDIITFKLNLTNLFGTLSSGGSQAHSLSCKLTNADHKTYLFKHTGSNPSCSVMHLISKGKVQKIKIIQNLKIVNLYK